MNKDERANRFIGHVETKEKGENGERKCVDAEERNGNQKKREYKKIRKSRWMKKKLIIERCN